MTQTTEASGGPRPIIVGVDGSDASLAALRYANRLAERLDLPIVALTTWQVPVYAEQYIVDYSPDRDAEEILAKAIETAFPDGAPARVSAEVVQGSPAKVLVERGAAAEMVVVGSRGRGGVAGLLLGSVSQACVQHSSSPVLVVHGDDR